MFQHVSVTEVSRNFSNFLGRVTYRGEHFILLRGKKAVAELGPAPHGLKLKELPALLKSLPQLGVPEAAAFGQDLASAKNKLRRLKIRDPWAS